MRGVSSSSPNRNALLYELFYRRNEKPETMRTEPIVLSSVLQSEVNANLSVAPGQLINKINGRKIDKLEDVITAFENNRDEHHILEFGDKGSFETLNRAEADEANPGILRLYGIPSDRRL